jgi:ribosomal protein L34E
VKERAVSREGGGAGVGGQSRCAKCGAPFHCGIDDADGCWCAKLPSLPRQGYAADATCLCEACLKEALKSRAGPVRIRD